ncbi:hypothetical protein MJO28_005916 [Puccinia striiformis f. sp. tritici]|uniref:Uncharacterized protein n=1 Tax=Puccinia striiformis f. sp. tritici TaxID=168172 RepID=A0ACC0EG03_9BASI|nr:hypothetical protein MJO28_005916 [Puccinia striiformis f. sp. tritici]
MMGLERSKVTIFRTFEFEYIPERHRADQYTTSIQLHHYRHSSLPQKAVFARNAKGKQSSECKGYPPFGVKVIDSCFERLMSAIVVAPMIAVLAMIIGCSILDDAGETDYQPLFIAARMGALGGPIAALFCVLISAALSQDQALEESIEPIEVIQLRRKLEGVRTCWGFITPYMIGMGGGPIGSGILRATNLAQTISPRSAVKATAIGGLFATPIYYLVTYLLLIVLRPCTSDDSSEDNEAEKTTARSMSSA